MTSGFWINTSVQSPLLLLSSCWRRWCGWTQAPGTGHSRVRTVPMWPRKRYKVLFLSQFGINLNSYPNSSKTAWRISWGLTHLHTAEQCSLAHTHEAGQYALTHPHAAEQNLSLTFLFPHFSAPCRCICQTLEQEISVFNSLTPSPLLKNQIQHSELASFLPAFLPSFSFFFYFWPFAYV